MEIPPQITKRLDELRVHLHQLDEQRVVWSAELHAIEWSVDQFGAEAPIDIETIPAVAPAPTPAVQAPRKQRRKNPPAPARIINSGRKPKVRALVLEHLKEFREATRSDLAFVTKLNEMQVGNALMFLKRAGKIRAGTKYGLWQIA